MKYFGDSSLAKLIVLIRDALNTHTFNKENPHGVTAEQVGAPPETRTINGKPLSADVKLSASDVGALPSAGGTLTGNLTGKYITGTWMQTTSVADLSKTPPRVAVLDGSGWVYYRTPAELCGDIGAVPNTQKGAKNGVASLGADGKVPSSQLPAISSVKTYTATIGTTWTEDAMTGTKTQNVAISGITAAMTAKVDHVYTGSGTSDDYAAFVKAENQYLTYITNGYAETYAGGIKFTIFGDANTVSIPIVVEVA